MKFKTFQYSFTLLVCLLSAYKGSAQKSIFEKDTVSFSMRFFQSQDQVKIDTSDLHPDPEIERKIFVDSKGVVHWDAINWGKWEYFLSRLYYSNIISDQRYKQLEELGEGPQEIPEFRTYLKDSVIHYETIGADKRVFFRVSLCKADTLKTLLEFMSSRGPSKIFGDYYNSAYTYAYDTTININGSSVDCYTFVMNESKVHFKGRVMRLYYSELLFEKKSLLPVFTKTVDFGRFYLGEDGYGDTETWINPFMFYHTKMIGVYKNGKVSGSLK